MASKPMRRRTPVKTTEVRRSRVTRVTRAAGRRLLGPRDAGRVMTEREYLRCDDSPGYKADIVDGVVRVSPSGNLNHQAWQMDIAVFLREFARSNPDVLNFVVADNDVVVPFRPGPTRPRPDVSAYRDFPPRGEWGEDPNWADFCPVLVVEVISRRRAMKDIRRNRQLYWSAGGILEYWIIDPRRGSMEPTLVTLTREGGHRDWTESIVEFGQTWTSPLLRGLFINLRAIRDNVG